MRAGGARKNQRPHRTRPADPSLLSPPHPPRLRADIHHLNARVPCYKLRECHEEGERLGLWTNESWAIKRMGWREAWGNLKYCMFDEERGRLVSMQEFDAHEAAAKAQ